MRKIYSSVEELVGNTPLVELNNISSKLGLYGKIIAKVEYLNPAGSAKDRIALQILDDAEKNGKLDKDTVIIEATSGNTGIGLAAFCAKRKYKLIIVMPDTMSAERIKAIRAYGAEVVLSDGSLGMKGSIDKLGELSKKYGKVFIPDQFANPSGPLAHYLTTGPEIYRDCDGDVDIFVATVGCGSTISGTGKYLKEKDKNIQVIGVEPLGSPVLNGGKPGKHKIQGIGAGFIPDAYDATVVDRVMTVNDDEAYDCARMLAKEEGLLCGISSGAALSAAIKLAKNPDNSGKNIIVLFPDTGDRYLSTDLFQ